MHRHRNVATYDVVQERRHGEPAVVPRHRPLDEEVDVQVLVPEPPVAQREHAFALGRLGEMTPSHQLLALLAGMILAELGRAVAVALPIMSASM